MNDKLLGMLGLCAKAGKCLYGDEACLKSVRSGRARLVFLSGQASANTRKRFENACAFHKVRLVEFDGDKAAAAVGRPAVKLIAIEDRGFSETIIKKIEIGRETDSGVEE